MSKWKIGLVFLIGMFSSAVLANAAVIVASEADNSFSVTGPTHGFTDWAVGNGAIASNFATVPYWPGHQTHVVSTSSAPSTSGYLEIEFTFSADIETAVVGFSSYEYGYGVAGSPNLGYNMVLLTDSLGAETLIYRQDSPERPSPVYYNYNGPTPSSGLVATTVNVTDLVSGSSSFKLKFFVQSGWSAYRYNDSFMLSTSEGLSVTGSVVPEPGTLGLISLGGILALRKRRKA